MTGGVTVECEVHFGRGRGGRKDLRAGPDTAAAVPPGRVPRVARLMALAIRVEGLIRDGGIADYAEVARLGHVTRTRVTQVMNLLLLAPDFREAILFLRRVTAGRDPLVLRDLQPLTQVADWRRQRVQWRELAAARGVSQFRADSRHVCVLRTFCSRPAAGYARAW